MADTYQFGLPLVAAAQAQKHVTVNESIALLDAVTQLRVVSSTTTTPPVSAQDGTAYYVPVGATGDWATHEGEIAVVTNGAWRYVVPKTGWQMFNEELGINQLFDGTNWLDCALASTLNGSSIQYKIDEIDHTISAGASSTTITAIPANAQVIGVTGRVIQEITGSLTSWQLGVSGALNRYGSGLGLLNNSFTLGLTGAPVTYYSATALELTADGGTFTDGIVRLAVQYITLTPPRAV